MIVIGELINCTRKEVRRAVDDRDSQFILELAVKQVDAGADYIAVNAGIPEKEPEVMEWLVRTVQSGVVQPLCLDSESVPALEQGLASYDWSREKPILNSISLDRPRFNLCLEVVEKWKPKVIALCMKKGMIKALPQAKVEAARELVFSLREVGLSDQEIILDPCILPISLDHNHGPALIETIAGMRKMFPDTHITGGVSNISFGMPARKWLNRSAAVILMGAGLDTLICDPTDRILISLTKACDALTGRDPDCDSFLKAFRKGDFPKL
jgi:5-methyltetrahydrofolate--homocysteine methyltransferase